MVKLALSAIFAKRNKFCDFFIASLDRKAFYEIGSALKGKNLLQ